MRVKLSNYEPVDHETVEKVSEELGAPISEEYKRFLMKYDGAVPEDNECETDEDASVERFIPIRLVPSTARMVAGLPSGAWPIAECGGGDYVFMRAHDEAVYYWFHEVDDGGRKISTSFDAFLSSLRPWDARSVKLQSDQVVSGWVNPDFKPQF